MKKLFKLGVLLSFAFIFAACKKDSSFFYQNNSEMNLTLQNERQDAGLYFAIGTTLPMNCKGDYHCGPCPGICVRPGKRPRLEYVYSGVFQDEEEGALRIISITDNSVKVEFLTDNFTINDMTYIEEDYSLADEVSNAYGYQEIILKQGIYEVDVSWGDFGSAVIDIETN